MADKKAIQESGFFQRIIASLRKTLRETIGELRKVSWPSNQETINLTRIVVIVILLMAVLLGSLDLLFTQFFAFLLSL